MPVSLPQVSMNQKKTSINTDISDMLESKRAMELKLEEQIEIINNKFSDYITIINNKAMESGYNESQVNQIINALKHLGDELSLYSSIV